MVEQLISVVTINLNNRVGLQKTLESVKHQSSRDFQYILIDGGSTDGSIELANCYSDVIDIFLSSKDTGVSDAFNKGIAQASGAYVLMLNSGDEFYSIDVIKDVLATKTLTDGLDVVCGGVLSEQKRKFVMPSIDKNAELVPHQSAFVGSAIYTRYGKYAEIFRIRMDLEYFLRLKSAHVSFKAIPLVIAKYAKNGMSAQKATRVRFYQEEISAYIMHGYYPKISTLCRWLIWKYISFIK